MISIPLLIAITLLCLAIPATRLVGIAGLALLFYVNPYIFTAVAAVVGVGAFFITRSNQEL